MRFAKDREGVPWVFFEEMAKAFREWRALHPYANPKLLADSLREQREGVTPQQADADEIPPRRP